MSLTWTKESILRYLTGEKNQIVSGMLKDLIATNNDRHEIMKQLYSEYRGNVPIKNKEEISEDAPNNQVPHDFRGEIVDQKAGYSYGNPVSYLLDNKPYTDPKSKELNEPVYQKTNEALNDFVGMNNLEKLDSTTGKRSGICGASSRLMYLNAEKKPRIMHVNPWETIFIRDQTIDEIVYALIYYTMQQVDENGDPQSTFYYVEWYDSTDITYYIEGKAGVFDVDPNKPKEPHGFKKVPVLEFPNKDEKQGDFEKVRELINAYDLLVSNNVDELEAFREAYLILTGTELTEELIEKMKAAGGLELPEAGKAEWLLKNINDQFVENTLGRLKTDIYRFAKAVDMSDEKFSGGSESGESRKWKLKSLSDDAILKERSFTDASREMFAVLKTYWDLFNIEFDPSYVQLQFTPNLPADLLYHANVTEKLQGRVSEKTRLSLLPFVDDPVEEIAQIAEESEASTMFDEELNKLGINPANQ